METSVDKGLRLLAKKLVIHSDNATSLPQSAVELQDIDIQGVYLKEVCNNYMSEQVIDQTLSNFIESETQQQSNCALRRDLRNGRITSSRFSEIYHRWAGTAPNSICKRLMGYTGLKGIPLPMKLGGDNETRARDAYLARMKVLGHKDIQCKPSGLTLMPLQSFLGASADGL